MKRLFALLRDTWNRYSDQHGDLLSAAVTFYSLLSLAPLAVVAVTIAGVAFKRAHVRAALYHGMADATNADVASMLLRWLDAAQKGNRGIAAVIALAMLAWAASCLFVVLQQALNVMWGVRVLPAKTTRESIVRLLVKRLVSFAMVLGSGTLLLGLLVLQTVMAGVGGVVKKVVHAEVVVSALGFAQEAGAALIVLTLICAVIYRVLPDARIRWRDVAVGASITALLILVGTALLGLYLSKIAPAWLQGAIGAIAVFMLWTYYLAQVFLIGAAFTRVWASRDGKPITPEAHAEARSEAPAGEREHESAAHSTRQSSAR